MIIRNGKVYRNLEEQVLKNKDDIETLQESIGTTVVANPEGEATDELNKIQINDTIYSIEGGSGGDVAWGNITGNISQQTDLKNALDNKQDLLTAGANITISNNVISATGSLSSVVWGQIGGSITDQTDLVSALDEKQDLIDANHKLPASNVSGLAYVATSGSYTDLINKPSIPTKTSDLTNDSNFSSVSGVNDGTNWTTITINGTTKNIPQGGSVSVNDFEAGPGISIDEDSQTDQIVIGVDQTDIPFKTDLASVAFSGNYNDLSNKPVIPVDTNTWRSVKVNGTQVLDGQVTGNALDLVAGSNITLTESNGAVTIAASGGGSSYSAGDGITISSNTISMSYPLIIFLEEGD